MDMQSSGQMFSESGNTSSNNNSNNAGNVTSQGGLTFLKVEKKTPLTELMGENSTFMGTINQYQPNDIDKMLLEMQS